MFSISVLLLIHSFVFCTISNFIWLSQTVSITCTIGFSYPIIMPDQRNNGQNRDILSAQYKAVCLCSRIWWIKEPPPDFYTIVLLREIINYRARKDIKRIRPIFWTGKEGKIQKKMKR